MTEVEEGQVYEDSMFNNDELRVKYADEEVVLLQDVEYGHHQVYPRSDFDESSERNLFQEENRFTLKDND